MFVAKTHNNTCFHYTIVVTADRVRQALSVRKTVPKSAPAATLIGILSALSACPRLPHRQRRLVSPATAYAEPSNTRATATATMPTTTVAVNTTAAIAVHKQSRADQSRQVTANLASASIPNTRASARRHAGIQITRVTGTVTTPTTTVAVPMMAATAAVPTLARNTARRSVGNCSLKSN